VFGLHWDEQPLYQSQKLDAYFSALEKLDQQNLVYPCVCSRKQIIRYYRDNPDEPPIYPGFCRSKQHPRHLPHALRIKTTTDVIAFTDFLQGDIEQHLEKNHGDFIILRRDRIIAYQLAAVVDEQDQQITQVVRGCDLLDSTIKQIHLQQQLNYHTPEYMHVPIVTDQQGCKLSKQSFAEAVSNKAPNKLLFQLLNMLRQNPPQELQHSPVDDLLSWAIKHWNPAALEKIRAIHSTLPH
jgi:glutamyl-Q tRNA(Asp) synthetase